MNKYEEDFNEFLKELSVLTQKHNIIIEGCGCKGSPYVMKFDDIDNDEEEIKDERFNLTYDTNNQCYIVSDSMF